MPYTTLVSAEQLQQLLQQSHANVRVFDCSFALMQPHAGARQFAEAHIPGAIFADLDAALSARHGVPGSHGVLTAQGNDMPASGGRHPLPNREKFAEWLSSVGMGNGMQAVVYDRNGANFCGRLWWMLKWVGHENVAVLDGGLQAWQAASGAVSAGDEPGHFQTNFALGTELAMLVNADRVSSQLGRSGQTLVDARAAPRFRGETEPLDPAAGHIPGALNRPFEQNFADDGKFKAASELKADFDALLGQRDPASVTHYCGSGVSALANVLAMEIAGLGRTALYAGSWSDWCADANRPIAQG